METCFQALIDKIQFFESSFDQIPVARQQILSSISNQLQQVIDNQPDIKLLFVCTHNSRRSHISQIWGQALAFHYGFKKITTFSGGTEATAFFPSAVKAMQAMGFSINKVSEANNSIYKVQYSAHTPDIQAFSKTVDHPENPKTDFVALMTCSHADANCPFLPGAMLRIPLLYDDPKLFDGTAIAEQKYLEKAEEIGRELCFIFSKM